jgi:PAS domain S-box-containing protein
MKAPTACVVRPPTEEAAAWETRLPDATLRILDPSAGRKNAPLLAESACVLIDGSRADALPRVTSASRTDETVQPVIVAPSADRERIQREILFTPGIGEVWLVSPEELNPSLLERAADVTERRRRHRRTRGQVAHALATLEPHAERRAVISDAYLASLLEAAPDPILSVDAEGVILSWNPGAERLLGLERGEAIGRRLADVLDAPALEHVDQDRDGVRRLEIAFRRGSGAQGVAECIIVPVEVQERRVYGIILHDLTEERRVQEVLQEQATELEAQAAELETQTVALEEHANELERVNQQLKERTLQTERVASSRSRFYAAMSHELRTPINAIMGYIALVLDGIYGPVPEDQRVAIARAQRAARHLLELVNDVLDLAKIEAGRLELQPDRACAPTLIEELLDTVSALAHRHGSTITVEGDGTHCIETDPRRVRQILLNLLSNAIKFGEGRPITVGWTGTPGGGLRIDVVDRGKGIAADDLERIFEEFVQLETQAEGGTGLGLPISRALAGMLGWSLTVTSAPRQGSTFSLDLPATLDASGTTP